ncbi:HIT family protein [Agromyces cerinus]|uniref:Histidine triad (HIT) family protein n=1 Tax=Agromyces cerinus subsp. cerinus TaxID=232089 RepID=A0A1N6FG42_9MICO|nr:HIT domain-containing protein [Agromyces cerinus]SIN94214.1 histidine triad (HIT) family protein [Agromyces cerinus subsp. cerinus]
MGHDCVFCAIVAGGVPAHRVYEDELTIAFLNIHPAAPGHTLLIPREHAPQLWHLSDAAAAGLGRSLRRVAGVVTTELEPDGMTVFQANGAAGWQSIFHVHFHLVPRMREDQLVPAWTETLADPLGLDPMAERLRAAFVREREPLVE